MTKLEALTALASKLDINYTNISSNALFSATDLTTWLQVGIQRAWDYKPWPFTTKTVSATTVDDDYYDHPPTLMLHSIFRLSVGGEPFNDPMTFDAYQAWKADNPTATDKNWSMHENFVFVNKHAYSVGDTMDMTGKKYPSVPSADSDLLPFSPTTDNSEHSGNHAIVEFAYAEALASDKLKRQAEAVATRRDAYGILDLLWKPFAQSMAFQQPTKPMFVSKDYFGGSGRNHPIGNFTL